MKFVDIGYILKGREVTGGYLYIVEGKIGVYRVYSKRYFDTDTVVYVYGDEYRYYIRGII